MHALQLLARQLDERNETVDAGARHGDGHRSEGGVHVVYRRGDALAVRDIDAPSDRVETSVLQFGRLLRGEITIAIPQRDPVTGLGEVTAARKPDA